MTKSKNTNNTKNTKNTTNTATMAQTETEDKTMMNTNTENAVTPIDEIIGQTAEQANTPASVITPTVVSDKEIAKAKAEQAHREYLAKQYDSLQRVDNTITFMGETWEENDSDYEMLDGMTEAIATWAGHTGIKEFDKQLKTLNELNKANKLNQLRLGKCLSEMIETGYYKRAKSVLHMKGTTVKDLFDVLHITYRTGYRRIAQYTMCSDINGEIDTRVLMLFTPAQIGALEKAHVRKELMQTVLNNITDNVSDITKISPDDMIKTIETMKSAGLLMYNDNSLDADTALENAENVTSTNSNDSTNDSTNDSSTDSATDSTTDSASDYTGRIHDNVANFISIDGKRGIKVHIDEMNKITEMLPTMPKFFKGIDNSTLIVETMHNEGYAFVILHTRDNSKVICFKCMK